MPLRRSRAWFSLLLILGVSLPAPADEMPFSGAKLISFDSGGQTLHGFLYKPAGPGPFPAVLWNHGSERLPGWQPHLAKFYVEHGYVFFIPHRSGQGRSPGKYIVELQRDDDPAGQVDGGIETLLTAEKGLGIRSFVAFAPGAMSWESNPLLATRLVSAVKNARAPVFVLQAQNDFSLEPSKVLERELGQKGWPNQGRVYPTFGTTHADGHGAFACSEAGIGVWGPDVIAFLNETNAPEPRGRNEAGAQ